MFVTSEIVYNNLKLNEINNYIKNTQLEYNQKYGYDYYREVNVKCNVKFFDKIENKTKNIVIEHMTVIGKLNKKCNRLKGWLHFLELSNWQLEYREEVIKVLWTFI